MAKTQVFRASDNEKSIVLALRNKTELENLQELNTAIRFIQTLIEAVKSDQPLDSSSLPLLEEIRSGSSTESILTNNFDFLMNSRKILTSDIDTITLDSLIESNVLTFDFKQKLINVLYTGHPTSNTEHLIITGMSIEGKLKLIEALLLEEPEPSKTLLYSKTPYFCTNLLMNHPTQVTHIELGTQAARDKVLNELVFNNYDRLVIDDLSLPQDYKLAVLAMQKGIQVITSIYHNNKTRPYSKQHFHDKVGTITSTLQEVLDQATIHNIKCETELQKKSGNQLDYRFYDIDTIS